MIKTEDIINNVLQLVESGHDLKNSLWVVLNNYTFDTKSHELVCGNDNMFILKKFIAVKKIEGKSEQTLKQYIRENKRFLLWCNKNVNEVTKDDILGYLADLQIRNNISMTTVTNSKRFLSAFFNWLDDEGYITKSPTRNLKSIKCPKTQRKAYTNRELDRLRNNIHNDRDKALVELLNSTGCRISEVININRNDINWNEHSIIVTGKGNKQRYVYFDDVTAMYLEKYLNTRKDSSTALFVSFNKNKTRLQKAAIESLIRRLGNNLGIKAYPHKFRRTYATRALQNGMSLSTLAKLMGHEKVDTTMMYCDIDSKQIKLDYYKCMN